MSAINSYLRLAMMFGDNHAHTFRTNLEKMTEIILFENTPKAMTVEEIVNALRDEYSLNFVDVEVTDAIEGTRGSGNIVCINPEVKRQGDKKYILTEKTTSDIEKRSRNISVSEISKLFLSEQPELSIDEAQLEDLLRRYFYRCFNSNANTIMRLINQDCSEGAFLSDTDIDEDFSLEEKGIVNNFIYWDNPEKDKFVYQMVACCFDYCSMTAKADASVFETVFKDKCFVLDTNIIFRKIGINKGARKQIIDAFLNKCNEVGIRLEVTNFTREEIKDTINRNVDRICDLIGNSQPMRPTIVNECASTGVNEDFYQFYYDWSQVEGHRSRKIEGFREDLLKAAEQVCQQFIDVSCISFGITKPDLFEQLSQNLNKYKIAHRGYGKIETAKTDVNNYLYVSAKNESSGIHDFLGQNYYHITADHHFCNWTKETKPGAIPEVILPSVWYSIILHYSGRATEEDYASFTRFLNFSYSSNEVSQDEKKTILLRKVSKLNEPIDVKEEIMLDVGKKLSSEYKDADDTTIDDLIRESNATVTERRVAEAVEEKEREKKLALESQMADLKAEVNRMGRQHEQEMNELKKNSQQAKDQYDAQIENIKAESAQRETNIRLEERNRYYKQLAEASAKKKNILYKIAFIFMLLIILAIVYIVCRPYIGKDNVPEGTSLVVSIVLGVFGIIADGILIKIFYDSWFCGFDSEKIEARELKRIKRKNGDRE